MNKIKLVASFVVIGVIVVAANELTKLSMPHGKNYSYQFTISQKWVSHNYYVHLGRTKYDDSGAYKSSWLADGDNDETRYFDILINPDNCEAGKGKVVERFFDMNNLSQGYQMITGTFTLGGNREKDRIVGYICKVAIGEMKEVMKWWPL